MKAVCKTKLDKLKRLIKETGGCAVAYSGGVDSSLVMKVAHEVLGKRTVAVIATSSTYSKREFGEALEWVKDQSIGYRVIRSEELDIPEFKFNPPDRCYFCKTELFTKVKEVAREYGFNAVLDGTNADDVMDYRPGMNAARALDILSPLKEAGLSKDDIRIISKEVYQLPMADKPAMACLASRFPYGSTITEEKLKQIESIEEQLRQQGFKRYRARHHGTVVRIELDTGELERMLKRNIRNSIVRCAKEQGFTYVTLDLQGYRTGSMNETL
jgi:uncharacterized protein